MTLKEFNKRYKVVQTVYNITQDFELNIQNFDTSVNDMEGVLISSDYANSDPVTNVYQVIDKETGNIIFGEKYNKDTGETDNFIQTLLKA